jgi:DNA-binding response OmpR family regulator
MLLGFDCIFDEAETGGMALQRIAETVYDVVFLDVKLPDRSGIEVLEEVRNRKYPIGPVNILTGFPEASTREAAERLSARYMTKDPIERVQIRSAFTDAVPGAATKTVTTVQVPNLPETLETPSARLRRPNLSSLLVLDDNEHWLKIIKDALEDDFVLTLTTSPREAIRHVRKDSFELVILDMILPRTSGFEVLTEMRKSSPDLRAIILTVHDDVRLANESGRRGALDYVKKDRDTLSATINEIIMKNPRRTHVFLSYDREDYEEVIEYYWRLTKRGFLPWMDDMNILGGKKWNPQIRDAIKRTDRFVYFLSSNSFRKQGVMRAEVNQALLLQEQKLYDSTFIVPVRLDECDIEPELSEFQVVDLFKPGGFEKLLQALTTE